MERFGGKQDGKTGEVDERWLGRIAEQVNGLEYGEVNIVVHDGRIVQIERKEENGTTTSCAPRTRNRAKLPENGRYISRRCRPENGLLRERRFLFFNALTFVNSILSKRKA